MSLTVVLCGMPEEKEVIAAALPSAYLLMGADKLTLQTRVPADCTRIVSCGLFGGLAPGLPVSSIAMASTVVDKEGTAQAADPEWNSVIEDAGLAAGLGFGIVPWYSSGLMDEADSAAQRAAMLAKYGATAIDDETRYCAAWAKWRGAKFNVFRSCSDDWTETLPLAATGPIMNADGSQNLGYLLRAIAQEPALQTIDLFKLGVDLKKSLDTLQYSLRVTSKVFLT